MLLNTIVYQVGYFFALRSGNEHRRLRHHPSQIQLYEPPGDSAYLVYREDISKTNQGGLTKSKNPRKCINIFTFEVSRQSTTKTKGPEGPSVTKGDQTLMVRGVGGYERELWIFDLLSTVWRQAQRSSNYVVWVPDLNRRERVL